MVARTRTYRVSAWRIGRCRERAQGRCYLLLCFRGLGFAIEPAKTHYLEITTPCSERNCPYCLPKRSSLGDLQPRDKHLYIAVLSRGLWVGYSKNVTKTAHVRFCASPLWCNPLRSPNAISTHKHFRGVRCSVPVV